MKTRFLFILALLMTFIGCSKNELDTICTPQIYFDAPLYSMVGNEVVVKLKAQKPFTQAVDVSYLPYSEEGTEGVDYSFKQKSFHFEPGDTISELHIAKSDIKKQMKIILNCNHAPEGYMVGLKDFTVLDVRQAYYEFPNPSDVLIGNDTYFVALRDEKRGKFNVSESYELPVEVVADQTTAVEGVHYEFADHKAVAVFAPNSYYGIIHINKLKVDKGHDKLVLRVNEDTGILPTNVKKNRLLTISIVSLPDPSGTWVFKGVKNYDALAAWGMDNPDFKDGIDKDEITFEKVDAKHYKMSFKMVSLLKDYFYQPQEMVYNKNIFFKQSSDTYAFRKSISSFTFPSLNYSFSQKQKDVKEGDIFIDVYEEEGKQYLILCLYNYHPADFLHDLYDWGMGSEDFVMDLLFEKKQ